jgi:hypothetical protein
MFPLAWTAAVLVVALSFAPAHANDPQPSFDRRGAQCSFSLDGRLYERLRRTGYASFGHFEAWAKRVEGGQALDVTLKYHDPAGDVSWGRAEAMELRSGDARDKLLLMRLKGARLWGGPGGRTFVSFADKVWEVRLP